MATVQSMTLARLLTLEADTVIGGHIDGSGDLILEQHDGSTINAGSSLPAIPSASTTVQGKVELATSAETITGTDTTRAVTPAGFAAALASGLAAFLSTIYPVGSIYMSTVSTSPATLFGMGTWVAIQGQFLIGVDGTYTAGSTGGAATKTLATDELPSHSHSFSATSSSDGAHKHAVGVDAVSSAGSGKFGINSPGDADGDAGSLTNGTWSAGAHTHTVSGTSGTAGSGTAFSILPPYVAVYIWKRTA